MHDAPILCRPGSIKMLGTGVRCLASIIGTDQMPFYTFQIIVHGITSSIAEGSILYMRKENEQMHGTGDDELMTD